MKQSTKKYLKLSLILYVVILAVAAVGTLAWFQYTREVAPTDEGNIISGKNVDICINDGNDLWGNEISISRAEKMPDISMTPAGDFYYPRALDGNDELITGDAGKGLYLKIDNPTGYFIKIPLKVRANQALDLYLEDTSFVKGVSIADGATSTTSADAIAGAARVAFFEVSGSTKTLKTVWIPNEKYQLYGTGNVDLVGNPEPVYYYLNVQGNTVEKDNKTIAWEDSLLSIGNDSLASCEDSSDESEIVYVDDATPLLSFTEAGQKTLEVCIWIEGTDREAKTLLSGGTISYELDFVGVESKKDPTIDINQVTYDAGKFLYEGNDVSDMILYSVDEKIWSSYMPGTPYFDDIAYIRVKETKDTKLGPVREW